MQPIEIQTGEDYIRSLIPDFSYAHFYITYFTNTKLLEQYLSEPNSYYKLQIFRVLLTVLNLKAKVKNDPLMKYIDEQFHVENDNIYYLNHNKYNLVPDFIIPACTDLLKKEKVI